jgi:hypothetical protein
MMLSSHQEVPRSHSRQGEHSRCAQCMHYNYKVTGVLECVEKLLCICPLCMRGHLGALVSDGFLQPYHCQPPS